MSDVATFARSRTIAEALDQSGGLETIAMAASTAADDEFVQLLALGAIRDVLWVNTPETKPCVAALDLAVVAGNRFGTVSTQQAVCEVLAAWWSSSCAQFAQHAESTVQVLARAISLHSQNEQLMWAVLKGLRGVLPFTELPPDAISELLTIMRRPTGSPDLQEATCKFFRDSMAAGTPASNLLDAGAFEVALGTMQALHLCGIRVASCGLLADLVAASPSRPLSVEEAVGTCLQAAMEPGVCSSDRQCFQEAFARLAKDRPEDAARAVRALAKFQPCCWAEALLLAEGQQAKQQLLESLQGLAEAGLAPAVSEEAGAEAVIDVLRSEAPSYPPALLRASLEALDSLAWADGPRTLHAGGASVAIAGLRLHGAVSWVCVAALELLATLLTRGGLQAANCCESLGAWDLVAATMRRHHRNRRVVEAAGQVLKLLSQTPGAC